MLKKLTRTINDKAARKGAVLLLAWLCLTTNPGLADERQAVDQALPANPLGHVEISLVRGDLALSAWDRAEIRVSGRLDEAVREFTFDVGPDTAVIAVQLPDNLDGGCCAAGSDLLVQLPVGSQVHISVVSTDVKARGIHGGIDIGSVSGDVNLADVHSRITVTSVSGDIEVRAASGRMRLKSVSGDIDGTALDGLVVANAVSGDVTLRQTKGELQTQTISGDIDLVGIEVTELDSSTVSGDLAVSGSFGAGANLAGDSVSGDIRLKFDHAVSARLDLQTRSGTIKNRLNDQRPTTAKSASTESLRMVLGAGEGEVVLQSRSGDITVSR
jgi:DUF4097 and DUF4098 domain-containing protein YvlB